MIRGLQLAAITRDEQETNLRRIPIHQSLQNYLSESWNELLSEFVKLEKIGFNPGYIPEAHEVFVLNDFELPKWMENETAASVSRLESMSTRSEGFPSIKGIAGFAMMGKSEVVMFQNFSSSHVIQPGSFLFLKAGIYQASKSPALVLESELRAVYFPSKKELVFKNFRITNTFLPLAAYYSEASERDIKKILGHQSLMAVNAQQVVDDSNQWTRKRFAMLRDSGVLDKYSPRQIQGLAKDYGLKIEVSKGRLVFPSGKHEVKRVLQFLNEELFRGAITNTLYETNSRRAAE